MSDFQAKNLARTLLSAVDPATCAACLDSLEAYVADQRAGRDYVALHPDTARHLDACVTCAEAYALLYELAATPAEALPAPARIPPPDLRFLDVSAAAQLAGLLSAALNQTDRALRLQFSPALLAAARAAPPALAYRDAAADRLFTLQFGDPAPAIAQVQISAHADPADASRCTLQAQVTLPDRDWPDLAGITIRATSPSTTLSAQSDAWGIALLPGIPTADLESLVVEVEV
jgi:hypothetical protein